VQIVADQPRAGTVGGNLRRLRKTRRLSLRGLAESSGLAVNTLSLIENNKSSPSVATLQQLAVALDVPIVSFFGTDPPGKTLVHLKSGQRVKAGFDHGTCEILGAGLRDQRMQPILVSLRPKADSGPAWIVHTGTEFVFCLEGAIDYEIESERYRLEPGDSLLFEAHLPHRWRNPEADVARVIMVLSPSDEHDLASRRHFALDEEAAGM
jgi:transcriptional regulator with XRE-family HTH domain